LLFLENPVLKLCRTAGQKNTAPTSRIIVTRSGGRITPTASVQTVLQVSHGLPMLRQSFQHWLSMSNFAEALTRCLTVSGLVFKHHVVSCHLSHNTLRLCLQLRQNPPACALGGPSITWRVSLIDTFQQDRCFTFSAFLTKE
jgi:hypothetical protein